MKEYSIVYAKDPDWSKIPKLDIDVANWVPNPDIKAQAQIAWNEDKLMYHGVAMEKNIRAVNDGPNLPVFEDSCLEFFFAPEGYDRYINMEVNPNCQIWYGIGPDMPKRSRLLLQHEQEIFNIKAAYIDGGWELSYEVPLTELHNFYPGLKFTEGMVLRANCYKCGDLCEKEHFLSWNPVECVQPSFHQPQYFGKMTLVK